MTENRRSPNRNYAGIVDRGIHTKCRKDRATHWLIKKAIDEYLAREEQFERERREDDKRWERYEATGEAISNERVSAWLDELAAGKRTSWRR